MFTTTNSNNIKNTINKPNLSFCLAYLLLKIIKILFLSKYLWEKGCLDHKHEESSRKPQRYNETPPQKKSY